MSDLDGSEQIELTLALIKPDAFDRAAEVEERIRNEGFHIIKVIRRNKLTFRTHSKKKKIHFSCFL